MRIAYVTADKGIAVFGTKGASIHVREMVNAFSGLGHDVTVLAARRGKQSFPLAAAVHEIQPLPSTDIAASLSLEDDDRARAKERYALQIGAAIGDRLIRFHRGQPFDLIYERYSLFSAAGVAASRALGIPCFLEVNAPLMLEQRKFRELIHVAEAEAIETEVFRDATGLIAVSEEVGAYALSKGSCPAQVHVVPNAVDVSRFHPGVASAAIEGAAEKFVVGFSGTLKPWHGLHVLMDSFRSLAAQSTAYHLLIVGEGPLRDWIEGYAAGAGLSDRVTVTGWIPHDDLPGLIRAMDVAVAPYPRMEDFYFSPLKLFEYMAVGTPVVASDVGQIASVIRDGENGLLSRPGDAANLAACIERLRRDRRLRESLGHAAVRGAEQRTWAGNAATVIALARPLVHAA